VICVNCGKKKGQGVDLQQWCMGVRKNPTLRKKKKKGGGGSGSRRQSFVEKTKATRGEGMYTVPRETAWNMEGKNAAAGKKDSKKGGNWKLPACNNERPGEKLTGGVKEGKKKKRDVVVVGRESKKGKEVDFTHNLLLLSKTTQKKNDTASEKEGEGCSLLTAGEGSRRCEEPEARKRNWGQKLQAFPKSHMVY